MLHKANSYGTRYGEESNLEVVKATGTKHSHMPSIAIPRKLNSVPQRIKSLSKSKAFSREVFDLVISQSSQSSSHGNVN